MKQSIQEILNASVEEKIQAVEAIWNSIEDNDLPVTNEDIEVAKDRYQNYLQNPHDVLDWENVKQKLMAKYGF